MQLYLWLHVAKVRDHSSFCVVYYACGEEEHSGPLFYRPTFFSLDDHMLHDKRTAMICLLLIDDTTPKVHAFGNNYSETFVEARDEQTLHYVRVDDRRLLLPLGRETCFE